MDDLLRGVERQQPAGCLRRVLPPSCFDLDGQQLSENGQRRAPIMQPLTGEPLIESGNSAAEAFHQRPAIDFGGLPKRVNGTAGDEGIEARDIHFHGGGTEMDRIAIAGEKICRQVPQCVSEIPRASSNIIDAKESAKVIQGGWSVAMKSEPGEERLSFTISDLQRISAVIGCAKFSKQTNCENRHSL